MSGEEVWQSVAQECPRRIIAALHQSGAYRHGTTPRFPGKVLCYHCDAELPADWMPTQAQQQAAGAQPSRPLPRNEPADKKPTSRPADAAQLPGGTVTP